jgi:hypothetical protein
MHAALWLLLCVDRQPVSLHSGALWPVCRAPIHARSSEPKSVINVCIFSFRTIIQLLHSAANDDLKPTCGLRSLITGLLCGILKPHSTLLVANVVNCGRANLTYSTGQTTR